jgi:hypothetical protein
MKIFELISESKSESVAVTELKKDLVKAKDKGVKLDYDGVGGIMEKVWEKHNITGQELHDVFVREVGCTPDTWIKNK